MTKKYRTLFIIFGILSLLATVGPFIYFMIYGFATGTAEQKIVLGSTAIVGIIFAALSLIGKFSLRGLGYIILIAMNYAIENIMGIIITLAVCTILDELVFTPLKKYFGNEYSKNKTIDKRIGDFKVNTSEKE